MPIQRTLSPVPPLGKKAVEPIKMDYLSMNDGPTTPSMITPPSSSRSRNGNMFAPNSEMSGIVTNFHDLLLTDDTDDDDDDRADESDSEDNDENEAAGSKQSARTPAARATRVNRSFGPGCASVDGIASMGRLGIALENYRSSSAATTLIEPMMATTSETRWPSVIFCMIE